MKLDYRPMTRKGLLFWAVVLLVLSALFSKWSLIRSAITVLARAIWSAVNALTTASAIAAFMGAAAASVLANWLCMRIQKREWERDVANVRASMPVCMSRVDECLSRIRDIDGAVPRIEKMAHSANAGIVLTGEELRKIRESCDSHLGGLSAAIGGQLPRSMFAYPPYASTEIAGILSQETNRMYQRHHRRVVIKNGHDTYKVVELRSIVCDGESCAMWALRFNVMWEWINDARTKKYPLRDLLVVVMAPSEEVNAYEYDTEGQYELEREKYEEFFAREDNIVRSIVAHPLADGKAIPEDVLRGMYRFGDVKYGYGNDTMSTADKEEVPSAELPAGVYAAYRLRDVDRALEPGGNLRVEYRGEICLPARAWKDEAGDEGLSGILSFPPSDVIWQEYKLRLVYPVSIRYGARTCTVAIDNLRSGCRFLHDPIETRVAPIVAGERLPRGFEAAGGENVAQIVRREPLIDYHHVCMAWTATMDRVSVK